MNPPYYGQNNFELITEDRTSEIEREYFLAGDKSYENGDRDLAIELYQMAGKDGEEKIHYVNYEEAVLNPSNGKYIPALNSFKSLGNYRDSANKYIESEKGVYCRAVEEISNANYDEAKSLLEHISDYSDTKNGYDLLNYSQGMDKMNDGDLDEAVDYFMALKDKNQFDNLDNYLRACREGKYYNDDAKKFLK